jgi:hypothetical protein
MFTRIQYITYLLISSTDLETKGCKNDTNCQFCAYGVHVMYMKLPIFVYKFVDWMFIIVCANLFICSNFIHKVV